MNGEFVYLWRTVDQSGEVPDLLAQKGRDAKVAMRFFRNLLKSLRYAPHAIVTRSSRAIAPQSSRSHGLGYLSPVL
jgi:transposase-like protein